MPGEIARQWFVPGDGIDRYVISADIQRYLGNDATVRPGMGTGENDGVRGYWIKAYRNLTSAMIADLKADSVRWRQEQAQTGTRGSQSPRSFIVKGKTVPDPSVIDGYVGSNTHQNANAAARNPGIGVGGGPNMGSGPGRRGGDSPIVDGPYPVPGRDRMPSNRMPMDSMDVDMPPAQQPDRRFQPQDRGYQQDNRQFPPDPRNYPGEGRGFAPDQQVPGGFGRIPVSQAGQDPRYAPSFPQSNGGPPPGYVRQGDFYVPVSSYDQPPGMLGRADQPGFGQPPYGQPQPPFPRNDMRDPRDQRDPRDPRYQPDYQDPRYAYPSPAATVSSLNPRDREPVTSPPQPSAYGGAPPQYDQYGRPMQRLPGQPEPGYNNMPMDRDPDFGRDRPQMSSSSSGSARPGPPMSSGSSRDGREAQRRRIR